MSLLIQEVLVGPLLCFRLEQGFLLLNWGEVEAGQKDFVRLAMTAEGASRDSERS